MNRARLIRTLRQAMAGRRLVLKHLREFVQRNPGRGRRDPGSFEWSASRHQILGRLLHTLNLPVSADEVAPRLSEAMTPGQAAPLAALLQYLESNQWAEEPRGAQEHSQVLSASDYSRDVALERRRNILFITGEFPNRVHGGGGRVFDFIRVLSQLNSIYLYSTFDRRQDADALELLRPYCRRIGYAEAYRQFESSRDRIARFLDGARMDIVHYEWPRSLTNFDQAWGNSHIFTFMEVVSRRLRIDLVREALLSPPWLERMVNLIHSLKVELVDTAPLDALITVSKRDAEFLARLNPSQRYTVLNHGVLWDEFCLPDVPSEDNALTFVGHFRHYPNDDAMRYFFKQIFDQIRGRVSSVKVYLVGADPPPQIRNYHDGRQVIVTGTVSDIRPYIQRARVCIAPLVTGAGLRGKLIQYAALRRPCVATSVAAADLLFRDGHEIFVADDPRLFAEKVIHLLQNPGVAHQMSEAAYHVARQHYDNNRLAPTLYPVYSDIEKRATHG
jgi:glycosyltransferase involved in cell wall biosynthesis